MTMKKNNRLVVKKMKMFLCVILLTMAFALSPAGSRLVRAKVRLNCSSKTMAEGSTLQLKVKGTRKKVRVTWKSSNKKYASVSKSGKVTAKKPGKATITAKIKGKGINTTRKVRINIISKVSYYKSNKQKLYNYIVKKGKYDKNISAWYMTKEVYNEGDGDGPVITVNIQALKNKKTLRFTVGLVSNTPDDVYQVLMTMNYNDHKPGVLYYEGYPQDYSPDTLEMNGQIDYNYKGKTEGIHWTHQKLYEDNEGKTTESDVVEEAYAARGNSLIGKGFKGWNALAKKAGTSMKGIGFAY